MPSGGVKHPAQLHQYTRSARKNGSRIRHQGNFADPAAKGRDNFNCVVALHIESPGFSIPHRVPRVRSCTESFGTTMLWRVTLQGQQGKSPLAIESIDDRYCHLPRCMMPEPGNSTDSPERSSYMVHENGKQRQSRCGSFIIRMNN